MTKHAAPTFRSRPRQETKKSIFSRVSLQTPHSPRKKKKLPFNKSAYFSLVWRNIPTIFIVPHTTHSPQRPRTGRELDIINITHTTTTLQLTPTTYKPFDFTF